MVFSWKDYPARKWHKSAHVKPHAWDSLLKANPAVFALAFVSQLVEEFGMCKLRKQILRRDLIAIHKYAERGKGEAIESKRT